MQRTYTGLLSGVLLLAIGAFFTVPPLARGNVLTYSLDGGTATMSGSVGSLFFSNATWALTASADPSGVTQGTLDLAGIPVPAYFLPASVALSITDSVNGVTSMTLNDPSGATWGVVSADYGSLSAGIEFLSFAAFSGSGSPWTSASFEIGIANGGPYGGSSGAYNSLAASGVWNGGYSSVGPITATASTSLGTMSVTAVNGVTGTGVFSIVPEPSSCIAVLAGLFCGGRAMRRRKPT